MGMEPQAVAVMSVLVQSKAGLLGASRSGLRVCAIWHKEAL